MDFERVASLCKKKVHLTNFGLCTRDIPYTLEHPGLFLLEIDLACGGIDDDTHSIMEQDAENLGKITERMRDARIMSCFELIHHDVEFVKSEIEDMNRDGFYPRIILTRLLLKLDNSFFDQTDEEAANTLIKLSRIINKMPKPYEDWKAEQIRNEVIDGHFLPLTKDSSKDSSKD